MPLQIEIANMTAFGDRWKQNQRGSDRYSLIDRSVHDDDFSRVQAAQLSPQVQKTGWTEARRESPYQNTRWQPLPHSKIAVCNPNVSSPITDDLRLLLQESQ